MARVVRQAPKPDLRKLVEEFRNAKDFAAQAKQREDQLKELLRERVEELGQADDKGSLWLEIDGVDGVKAVKNERRVAEFFDEEAAQEWCEEHDIDCTKTVTLFDQDKFWALVWDKTIPKRTANGFKKEKVSWALKLQ